MLKAALRSFLFPLILLTASSLLLFPNIGRNHMWQDEAQFALISKSILQFGIPSCGDGLNSFSQELGADCGSRGAYKWHPWLSYYLHALSFKIFGMSDTAVRIPDALFGIMTILSTYWIMLSMGRSRRAAFFGALSLLLMVPFLLLSRQCRYFSMSAFWSLWVLYGYFCFLRNKKHAWLFLSFFSLILFYTQVIYCLTFWAAILAHAFFDNRARMIRLLPVLGLIGLGAMPWLFFAADISSTIQNGHSAIFFSASGRRLISYGRQFSLYIFPASLVLFCGLLFLWKKYRQCKIALNWDSYNVVIGLSVIVNLLLLSFLAQEAFFRYLTPLLPLVAVLLGEIFEYSCNLNTLGGWVGLLILLANQPYADYLHELTHPFRGPMEGLVQYFGPRIKTQEVIAITYGDMPLKWYLNSRIVGGLTGERLNEISTARWVIFRKHIISEKDQAVARYFEKNIDWNSYRKIVLDVSDTAFENRESPRLHLYKTVTDEDPVVIYEKFVP